MNRTTVKYLAKRLALGLAALALTATPSFAQTAVSLCVSDGTVTMDDGVIIPIWGFVDTNGAPCTTGLATLPGEEIRATAGDALTVDITNALSVPVSFFVPGLRPATATGTGGLGLMAAEAAASGGTASYAFTNLRAGTFFYHSGTDINIQVPMGMYGALVVDVAAGQAYGDVAYDRDQVLLYSEIDPNLNAGLGAVDARVVSWDPQYFLINGIDHPNVADLNITSGEDVLLRFVNAGLRTFFPTLDGGLYMQVKAEDGFRYPQTFEQYGIELQAGKTIDAMITTGADGTYSMYDRGAYYPDSVSYIVAGAAAGAPTVVDDGYAVAEDGSLAAIAGDLTYPGVLDNDTGAAEAILVSAPSAGTLVGGLATNGSFTYQPSADFNGIDIFTYKANDGAGGADSTEATVTITVTPVNDDPSAVADYYDAVEGEILNVAAPGVLANDVDIDGDGLTAAQTGAAPAGILVLNTDGSFDYTPAGAAGAVETFQYVANDGTVDSAPATVTLTVTAAAGNIQPFANDDFATMKRNDPPVTFSITANDVDPDGTIDVTTVVLTAGGVTQRGGTVVENGDGTVTYTPKRGFRGTDLFRYTVNDDQGATSNEATVRINVTR